MRWKRAQILISSFLLLAVLAGLAGLLLIQQNYGASTNDAVDRMASHQVWRSFSLGNRPAGMHVTVTVYSDLAFRIAWEKRLMRPAGAANVQGAWLTGMGGSLCFDCRSQ